MIEISASKRIDRAGHLLARSIWRMNVKGWKLRADACSSDDLDNLTPSGTRRHGRPFYWSCLGSVNKEQIAEYIRGVGV